MSENNEPAEDQITNNNEPEAQKKLEETVEAVLNLDHTYCKSIIAFLKCQFQDIPISHRFYFIQALSLSLFLIAVLTVFYIASDSDAGAQEEFTHSREVFFKANGVTDYVLDVNNNVVYILNNNDPEGNFDKFSRNLNGLYEMYNQLSTDIHRLARDEGEKQIAADFDTRFDELDVVYKEFTTSYQNRDTYSMLTNVVEISNLSLRFLDIVRHIQKPYGESMYASQETNQEVISLAKYALLIFFLVNLATTLFTGLSIRRSMQIDVLTLLHTLINIAKGNLNSKVSLENKNEIGSIAKLVNGFVGNTKSILLVVKNDIDKLNNVIAGNRNAMERTNMSLSVQREAASDVVTAASSLEDSIAKITDFAKSTLQEVQNAEVASETCRRTMSDNITTTHTLSDRLHATSEAIKDISQMGDKIDQIVKTIADIADQTNLLALNASIEAARAGDQGRGFAVVADEVRELAIKTASSTKEVSSTIQALTRAMNNSVNVVASCEEEMGNSLQQSSRANSSIEEIMGIIATISDMSEQIVQSCQIQSSSAANINNSISNISELVDDSFKMVSDIHDSMRELHDLAQAQSDILDKFDMEGTQQAEEAEEEDKGKTDKKERKSTEAEILEELESMR